MATSTWTAAEQTGDPTAADMSGTTENIRVIIKNGSISTSGTQFRIKIQANSGLQTWIDAAAIGLRDGSTRNYSGSPTQIKWDSGSTATTIAAGNTKWSDWMTFSIDEANDYLIHIYTETTNNMNGVRWEGSGDHQYYCTWPDADLSMTVDLVSACSTGGAVDDIYLLEEIEVRSAQTISDTGDIASAEAFGTSRANFKAEPSAIASLEAHGTPQFNFGLPLSGIPSAEIFGSHRVQLMTLVPGTIASLEDFGTPNFVLKLLPDSMASSEAFGTAVLKLYLIPSSIVTLEGFGTPDVEWRLGPSGIPSLEAFGSLSLALAVTVLPDGIASAEGFGTPVFVKEILPYTAISKEALGHPELTYMILGPSGIASLGGFGSHQVNLKIIGEAISSEEAFGTFFLTTMASIYPEAIASLETFGSVFLYLINTIHPVAIESLEVFGSAKLTKYLVPPGITSLEAIGDLNLILAVQYIDPDGVLSGEAFGVAQVISRLTRMAIAEAIGVKEKVLRSSRTYSGGEDIINRILTSIWRDIAKQDTVWEVTTKTKKDE